MSAASGGRGRRRRGAPPHGRGAGRDRQEPPAGGAPRARGGAGTTVLAARGSVLEREFGFGVVRQLSRRSSRPRGGRPAGGGGRAGGGRAGRLDEGDEGGASFAALHGLYWVVVKLAARRPVVLCVDDLQWSDSASLRFVAYLARRLAGPAPAAGVRPPQRRADSDDPALLAEIGRTPSLAVQPGPLERGRDGRDGADVSGSSRARAFAAACTAAPGATRCCCASSSPPSRTTRCRPMPPMPAGAEIGPRAVSRAVLLRLARLPAPAPMAARAVAILGESRATGDRRAGRLAEVRWPTRRRPSCAPTSCARRRRRASCTPSCCDAVYADLRRRAPARSTRGRRTCCWSRRPAEQIAAQLLHAPPRGMAAAVATLREAAHRRPARGERERGRVPAARAGRAAGRRRRCRACCGISGSRRR